MVTWIYCSHNSLPMVIFITTSFRGVSKKLLPSNFYSAHNFDLYAIFISKTSHVIEIKIVHLLKNLLDFDYLQNPSFRNDTELLKYQTHEKY